MRLVIGFSLILWGIGHLACQVEGTPTESSNVAVEDHWVRGDHWVRTVDGWEKTGQWAPNDPHKPALHPLVIASLEGMLSLMALLAFYPTGRDQQVGRNKR